MSKKTKGKKQENKNDSTGNSEKCFLKKWFKWDRIVGLATIIAALVAIYSIWPDNKIDKLKKDIEDKSLIIKTSIHPVELLLWESGHPDVKLIFEFQTNLQQFVYDWDACEVIKLFSDFENEEVSDALNTISSLIELHYKSIKSLQSVHNSIEAIMNYGRAHNINAYIPNEAKWKQVVESINKWDRTCDEFDERSKVAIHSLQKILEEGKTISPDDCVNAAKPFFDKMNEEENYQFIYDALSYFIELNNQYVIQLLKYQSENFKN